MVSKHFTQFNKGESGYILCEVTKILIWSSFSDTMNIAAKPSAFWFFYKKYIYLGRRVHIVGVERLSGKNEGRLGLSLWMFNVLYLYLVRKDVSQRRKRGYVMYISSGELFYYSTTMEKQLKNSYKQKTRLSLLPPQQDGRQWDHGALLRHHTELYSRLFELYFMESVSFVFCMRIVMLVLFRLFFLPLFLCARYFIFLLFPVVLEMSNRRNNAS